MHIFRLFHLLNFALGLLAAALRHTRARRPLRKNRLIVRNSPLRQPPVQILFDNAVNLQIGIPSYRRCKMTIIPRSQPEMTQTLRRIPRLPHRAKGKAAQKRLLRSSSKLRQKSLQLLRMHLVADMQTVPEVRNISRELAHLLDSRILVNPVDKRQRHPTELLRYGLVGQHHKILNQRCRAVSLMRLNRHDAPPLIQHNPALRKIEIDCTSGFPLGANQIRRPAHRKKHRDDFGQFRKHGRIGVENRLNLCIREPSVDANHRLANLMRDDGPCLVERHKARERQAVLPLIERADSVGKRMRKHRNDPIRKIHAGAAVDRFTVKRRILPHIMAHIRNVNAEHKMPVLLCKRHGVVEILRLLAVDGDGQKSAEIPASFAFRSRNLRRSPRSLKHHFLRKIRRQIIGANHRQNVDARVVYMP